MRLSVLDLVPVRSDQRSADALAATVTLARAADELGYTRYWLAEHHNMAPVAATSPPVLIGYLAAQTSRIRLGSGGVMLPNHAPLAVAEQFALLEAAAPGRIDLGIGRPPGSDPVTSAAMRGWSLDAHAERRHLEAFPEYVDEVDALMSPNGARVELTGGRDYTLRATPVADGRPRIWLLGSSLYSARLAAAKGLPYVFAHHFAGRGTAEALAVYREEFTPSAHTPAPQTFLTVNASVAPTRAEAERLALPNRLMMAWLRGGKPIPQLLLVEDAEQVEISAAERAAIQAGGAAGVVGTPAEAADQLRALAETFGVDEVMINPVGSALRGTPADSAPARTQTLALLAQELL
ncbi:LLM class flavin-dependent oxidoreductase [Mycolicibacterium brumae]|uniref:LLM class flavin-dependent oxidoreductase n=1 Tax=Mycolicibacterium brumae TaxID=85968 RepID=A0A2G5PAQ8_9MYCO|nr:LLM class flavin-dependent oxidoreductase [Mycolicibacterium brumae]MCV7192138.1 LLM class flavin-dependent oxidoreductase [Mycolicibacterium brumae]PIB75406.1 LLM class flavin-dependent oxidoreductase [Mycolicibacterium brumae]UWW07901.1 LLM class flavin-dependent oxidoreductase [Mycolicibacterium brumae]